MQRRDFVAAGAAVIAGQYQTRNAERGTRNGKLERLFRVPTSDLRVIPGQEPSLSPEVFARRLDRARGELKARGLDLLIATPSTNYEYLTGYNPGRSERLIALLLPVVGAPAIVCPSFEVERIKRHSIVTELHGWEEQEDPHALVRETARRLRPGSGGGTIALESSTAYQTFLRLGRALPGWKFVDAGPVTDRLRVIKSPEEVALLRRAIAITLDAMAATFAQLAVGTTEVQVAQTLSREMEQRGAPGGGLVQFGPSSALPHGGPAGPKLERETVVLIDCGCRVGGYTSDITRTIWFGDRPSEEFRKRRDVVVARFRQELPGVEFVEPLGAFYFFFRVDSFGGISGTEFCTRLVTTTGVALVPGAAFGDDRYVRLSYAASLENIQKALDRIIGFGKKLAD